MTYQFWRVGSALQHLLLRTRGRGTGLPWPICVGAGFIFTTADVMPGAAAQFWRGYIAVAAVCAVLLAAEVLILLPIGRVRPGASPPASLASGPAVALVRAGAGAGADVSSARRR